MTDAVRVVAALLEEAGAEVEDLALDYVENQVGHYHFVRNWRQTRSAHAPQVLKLPRGPEILAELDRLAADGTTWSDAYPDTVIELERPDRARRRRR